MRSAISRQRIRPDRRQIAVEALDLDRRLLAGAASRKG
jgi:hypothetical protein